MTSKCGKNITDTLSCALCAIFCSNHMLLSSVISYWTDAWHHGIYLLSSIYIWLISGYRDPFEVLWHSASCFCHVCAQNRFPFHCLRVWKPVSRESLQCNLYKHQRQCMGKFSTWGGNSALNCTWKPFMSAILHGFYLNCIIK